MLSGKVLLLSTGVLSTGVALRLTVPAVAAFLRAEVPRIYGAVLTWLTPPYLYFIINVIIISIAASSRFHKPAAEEAAEAPALKEAPVEIRQEVVEDPPALVVFAAGDAREEVGEQAGEEYGGEGAAAEERVVVVKEKGVAGEEGGGMDEEEFVISRSSWTPRRESLEVPPVPEAAEKPLVSVRFATRRGAKASPDGRPLGVARQKKNETLENTWKAITDGRSMPLARHLKKSDTWASDGCRAREDEAAAEKTPVRKTETFKERRAAAEADSSPSPSASSGGSRSGKLRREASLGQDDLNRRVEAFIRKFNEEMRLQRQESFKHYMEMINRGSH